MITDRMRKALDAGGVMALFQALKDWPDGELRALVDDCEAYSQEANAAITAAYKKAIFKPEVFFQSEVFGRDRQGGKGRRYSGAWDMRGDLFGGVLLLGA